MLKPAVAQDHASLQSPHVNVTIHNPRSVQLHMFPSLADDGNRYFGVFCCGAAFSAIVPVAHPCTCAYGDMTGSIIASLHTLQYSKVMIVTYVF